MIILKLTTYSSLCKDSIFEHFQLDRATSSVSDLAFAFLCKLIVDSVKTMLDILWWIHIQASVNQTFLLPKQCLEGSGDLFGFNNVFTSVCLHQRLVFQSFWLINQQCNDSRFCELSLTGRVFFGCCDSRLHSYNVIKNVQPVLDGFIRKFRHLCTRFDFCIGPSLAMTWSWLCKFCGFYANSIYRRNEEYKEPFKQSEVM